MAYTQADADAAKAKIAADNATLATQTQAVSDAQTALASAQTTETTAETQLTAAQDALASAQGAATDAASKLDAANSAAAATKADIATEQAIVDAYAAQVPPTPTQGSTIDPISGRTMPDQPLPPVGPFTPASAIVVKPGHLKIALNKAQFGAHYICIASNDADHPGQPVEQFDLQDILCADGTGTLARFGGMLGASCPINIGRVLCNKALKGRYALRFNGMFPQPITIDDLTWLYGPNDINEMTGNIATGLEVGAKQAGEAQGLVHVKRARVENIHDGYSTKADGTIHGWAPTKYWNGDGLTTEASLLQFIVEHLTARNITDGSIDSKAKNNTFGNVFQQLVRGLKIWGNMKLAYHTSITPVVQGGIGGASHYRFMGDSSGKTVREFHIDDSWCTPDEVLFHVEGGPVRIIAPKLHYDGTKVRYTSNGGSITADSVLNGSAIK